MINIIGIDPGLSATGIGVIRGAGRHVKGYSYGCINTPKQHLLPVRLEKIYSNILRVLNDEKPDLMVVEDIFSLEKYPKSGINLGKVSGVILLAGCQADVPVIEIQVREAKQVLTGNGKAGKHQLETTVRRILNITAPIRPFHASDALGLALIGLYRYGK